MSVSNSQVKSSSQCPSRAFTDLMEKAERQMKKKGYSYDGIYQHRSKWRQMARYFREQFGDDTFSVTKAAAYLESEGLLFDQSGKSPDPKQWRIRAAVRSLTDVALHGASCFKVPRASLDILPPRWKSALEDFLDHLINEAGRRPTSVKRTQYMLRQFLVYLADLGITEPVQLNRFHARDYLASRLHWMRNTLHINARLITQLLRYLYLNGLHSEDLSAWVPRIPCDQAAEIPIVYSSEEVDRLLAAVDRDNSCGKRNYAILLLAARLGLRWGDIRRLRFDNLRWDEERIVLDQAKTGGPLVLPLTDEIGSAIIDYLKHGRPVSDYREIFLKSAAPIEPFGSFSGIGPAFTCYKRRAGIRDEPGRRCGMHSLRHTLASRLMEQGTPMQTISDILGHAGGVESTKHYLRIDIETLRRAALDIEEEV